jgi:GT2 family glycosyltransferase
VIILTHNGKGLLGPCIASVQRSRYPRFEVIIVDNASSDDTVANSMKEHSADGNFRVVRNDRNLGFAEGNNIGANHARGELLVFINDDTQVSPNWLDELTKTATVEPSVAIVLPRIIWDASPDGLLVGNVDRYGNPSLVDLRPHLKESNGSEPSGNAHLVCSPQIETIAAGPAFLIKREVWEQVGGFDPKYFIYAEDTDLSWRAKLLGYKTVLSYGSLVQHKISGTMRRSGLERRRYLTYRNMLRTLIKNYSTWSLRKVIPVFLTIKLFEALGLCVTERNPRVVKALSDSLAWNLRNLKDTWEAHSNIQLKRVSSEKDVQQVMTKLAIPGFGSKFNASFRHPPVQSGGRLERR